MEGITVDIFGNIVDKAFSIVVAAFLLLRMERELRALRGAIEGLRHCAVCVMSPLAGVRKAGGAEDKNELHA